MSFCTITVTFYYTSTFYCTSCTTSSAPPPMAPPLATSTPTPGFVEGEDTSALLESLCSLLSSPRESYYDSHPARPPPNNSIWSPHNRSTVTLHQLSSPILPRYFEATSSVSSSSLPPQPQVKELPISIFHCSNTGDLDPLPWISFPIK